jgi:hypothetical protein
MAQSTILAAAQTAATSTDVTVAAGSVATIGIFAAGEIPDGVRLSVRQDTPSNDNFITHLHSKKRTVVVAGPGVFRVYRPNISAYGTNVGVFSEA